MRIAYHIGANCTDDDKLLKSLLRNADNLLKQGISVPGPGKYRSLIRETIQGLDGRSPAADTRDILLDTIIEEDGIKQLVMSNTNFICVPNRIFENGVFYGLAGSKVRGLTQIFPDDDVELFLGIRNPATFLQETFTRASASTLSEFLGLIHPQEIQWSSVVKRIANAAPSTRITVWCNEDTPLIWEQLLRQISGVSDDTRMSGGLSLLAPLITPDGMTLLKQTLVNENPETNIAYHEIIARIWENHAIPTQVEDLITLPEFDAALVHEMTQSYDDDLSRISEIDNVKMLVPFT